MTELSPSTRLTLRWVLAGLLALLATVGAVGSAVGRWTHGVLLDTDKYMETVGPVGTSDEVTAALAALVTREATELLDAEARLTELFPPAFEPVAGLIADAINGTIAEQTERFFQSDLYEDVWLGVNRTAHGAMVSLIRDEVPFFSTAGGVIIVDLEPFLAPVIDDVIERIRDISDRIPDFIEDRVEFDDALAGLIRKYETQGFPERLNSVVLYESETLGALQDSVALFDRLVVVLPVLSLALAITAVLVAPNRRLMLPIMLIAAGIAWLSTLWGIDLVTGMIVDAVASDQAAVVAEEILNSMTVQLASLLTFLVWIAIGLGLASAGWAIWERRQATPTFPGQRTLDD